MNHHHQAPAASRPRRTRSPPPPPVARVLQHGPAGGGDAEPAIPLLRSTGASIFVPLTTDLVASSSSASPADPSDRVAHLNAVLAELDTHAVQVRANIRALVRRECVRVLREAAADQARLAPACDPHHHLHHHQQPPPSHPAPRLPGILAPQDRTVMIANMEASHGALVPEHLPPPDFSKAREPANPQEWANKELMAAVSKALSELRGFDAHTARTRTFYEHALKREIARVTQ